MDGMLWALVLLAVGLLVMVLEVFVPSGGVLGFVSILAIVAAIVTAFSESGIVAGLSLLASAVVLVPVVLLAAFRWFPITPLGRRVLPDPPHPEDVLPDRKRRESLRALVGRRGLVVSELVPWGEVAVGNARVEAYSIEGPVVAGQWVTVVGVDGLGVAVRRADASPSATLETEREVRRPQDQTGAGENRLSRTLEEFDFGQLDPPGEG